MEKYGQLTEYQADIESIENYEQRAPDVKRVPVFLSVIGASNFSLLSSLLATAKPSEKTVDELFEVHNFPRRV